MNKIDLTTVQDLQQHMRAFPLSKPLIVKAGSKVMKVADMDEDKNGNVVVKLKAK